MELDDPIFFDTDSAKEVAELTAEYEALVGFTLSPGQAEQLLINAIAYRFNIKMIQANEAAKQNLLRFARYPAIDYLGELVGVTRLPASKATTRIEFTLVTGHPALVIPQGIRVQSIDGKVVFETLASVNASPSDNVVSVDAECTTDGIAGNDYIIGDISIILDPQAYVATAKNPAVTSGGADTEDDDGIRERIRLAPSSFSSAGPDDAYVFFAKSANQEIIDVGITSPVPGEVHVFPLMKNGALPTPSILNSVYEKLNPKKVRPLNDIVIVSAPTRVSYTIQAELVLLEGAIDSAVLAQVQKNAQIYADERNSKLGRDAVRTQLFNRLNIDGVYEVNLVQPATDIEVDRSQVAHCTGINITITGHSDE